MKRRALDHTRGGLPLTDREHSTLQCIARGRTNAEIGQELGVAEDTVKSRLRSMFSKLGARDRAHAVAIGYQRGHLFTLDTEATRG